MKFFEVQKCENQHIQKAEKHKHNTHKIKHNNTITISKNYGNAFGKFTIIKSKPKNKKESAPKKPVTTPLSAKKKSS